MDNFVFETIREVWSIIIQWLLAVLALRSMAGEETCETSRGVVGGGKLVDWVFEGFGSLLIGRLVGNLMAIERRLKATGQDGE
jgi:hypothetical protein